MLNAASCNKPLELAALTTRIPGPQSHHQEERELFSSPRHIAKPRQRRIIGPLHIIHRHDEWAVVAPICQQPVEAVSRGETIRRRLARLCEVR